MVAEKGDLFGSQNIRLWIVTSDNIEMLINLMLVAEKGNSIVNWITSFNLEMVAI